MNVHLPVVVRCIPALLATTMICLLAGDPGIGADIATLRQYDRRPGLDRPGYAPDRIVFELSRPAAEQNGSARTQSEDQDRRSRALVLRNRLIKTDRLFGPRDSEPFRDIHIAHLPPGAMLEEAIERLRDDPDVAWAEPDYYRYTSYTEPNDALYQNRLFGQPHLDRIEAQRAWDNGTGDPNILIAIIDTGVSYNHEDLFDNIWVNPGEVPDRNHDGRVDLHDLDLNGNKNISQEEIDAASDGLDDDGNGYTDDIMGWDFVEEASSENVRPGEDDRAEDNDPDDFEGHGTMVAGTAAAVGNNGIGVAGITWRSKIMILRAGYAITTAQGDTGRVPATFVCKAIRYAVEMGADVINISSGGDDACGYERAAFDHAARHGCVIVASAGNEDTSRPHYPSSYEAVVSVAATSDVDDGRAGFSNYGLGVDLAAPGLNVRTTSADGGYEPADGTSFASPIVAGVAALVRSAHRDWDHHQIMGQLLATADNVNAQNPSFAGMLGAGRINAHRAIDPEFLGPRPRLVSTLVQYSDGDDLAGRPTAELYVTIRNFGCPWGHVTATLRSADPLVTIQEGRETALYGIIAGQRRATNATAPYVLCLAPGMPSQYEAALELDILVNGILLASEPLTVPLPPYSAPVMNWPEVVPADGETTTDPNVLIAHWSRPSGPAWMFACTYGVGRAPGQADVIDWRSIADDVIRQDMTCVPLVPGQPYYVNLKVRPVQRNATYLAFSAPVTYVAVAREGALELSRGVYRRPDLVQIRLVDLDLQGAGTSYVDAATDGGDRETILLAERDVTGIFDGSLQTSGDAPITGDGILHVRHGDSITVTYVDSDPGTGHPVAVTQSATVDCRPPAVSQVNVIETSHSEATVAFDTDEPTSGTVRYGSGADALDRTAVGTWSSGCFVVELGDLEPNATYVFAVVASDEAGNRAVDDNRGRGYVLRTAPSDASDNP